MPFAWLRRFSSFWIYPAAALGLGWLARESPGGPPVTAYAWLVPLGCVLWTLIEYGLHRFVFHWEPASPALRRAVSRFHATHHARPRDPDQILARPSTTLPLSLALWSLAYGLTRNLTVAAGVMTGIWLGFLYYEWVHYRVHTSASNFGLLGHRRRHFHHHFVDRTTGFGVTSAWWDHVFGTAAARRASSLS